METERFDAFSDLLKTASLNLQQFLYLLKAMRQRGFLRDNQSINQSWRPQPSSTPGTPVLLVGHTDFQL